MQTAQRAGHFKDTKLLARGDKERLEKDAHGSALTPVIRAHRVPLSRVRAWVGHCGLHPHIAFWMASRAVGGQEM